MLTFNDVTDPFVKNTYKKEEVDDGEWWHTNYSIIVYFKFYSYAACMTVSILVQYFKCVSVDMKEVYFYFTSSSLQFGRRRKWGDRRKNSGWREGERERGSLEVDQQQRKRQKIELREKMKQTHTKFWPRYL